MEHPRRTFLQLAAGAAALPLFADTKIKAPIVELGGTVLEGSPVEFGTIISDATAKWAKVIKFAGIKAE